MPRSDQDPAFKQVNTIATTAVPPKPLGHAESSAAGFATITGFS